MSANDDELLQLIHAGRKLDAIKRLREARGLGLSEAKAEVERLSGSPSVVARPAPPRHVDSEVRQLAQSGQRIAAIKLLRERSRLGLKEAKDLLDETVPPPPGRPLPWAVAFVVAAAVVALAAWLLR